MLFNLVRSTDSTGNAKRLGGSVAIDVVRNELSVKLQPSRTIGLIIIIIIHFIHSQTNRYDMHHNS